MSNNTHTITISAPYEYDAEEFRHAIKQVARTIVEILRLSNGCEVDASEIANKTYVLDWLLNEVEIKDENKQ